MRAAFYEHRGPAAEVLQIAEVPTPEPGPGEVRIAVAVSGLSPGDVKKRTGWQGQPMPFPRVIPHSDGAGRVDAVGEGVDPARLGRLAWCYGAQSYRAFGTAAEAVVVPAELAVDLPDVADASAERALLEQAACLGIAGITGYRAIFADGPVDGLAVLVHGAAGGVGSIAAQMARRGGATVIALVRPGQEAAAAEHGAHHVLTYGADGLVDQIRAIAPDGVARIAEVEFASHIDLDAEVIGTGATIAAYFSAQDRPEIPYWKLAFADTTLRLLGSDDFAPEVKADAAAQLSVALVDGALRLPIVERVPLEEIARAHDLVEHGAGGRVVLEL